MLATTEPGGVAPTPTKGAVVPADYVVKSVAVDLDGVTYQSGDTFTAELTRAQRWLVKDGHIAKVDPDPSDGDPSDPDPSDPDPSSGDDPDPSDGDPSDGDPSDGDGGDR